jgi:CHASE1-domain containing sensor protein
MGIERPALLGARQGELDLRQVRFPLFAVLDILPRTDATLSSIGLVISELPAPSEALIQAQRRGDVAATAPLELVQMPGVRAIIIYVPVHSVAEQSQLIGLSASATIWTSCSEEPWQR